MATDEKEKTKRNFRSAYYEKVGCRSVEEKKSLEILLKDKPLNKLKLKQFCLRFTVPTLHRNILWNLLLNIYPNNDVNDFVKQQRLAVYNDLLHALTIMRLIDENTPKQKIFHTMWLLENKKLHLGYNIHNDSNFVTVTEILLQSFDVDFETYWKAKGFYEYTKEIENESLRLIDFTHNLLQKEDNRIYTHLESKNLLSALPLQEWYQCCFAGIIAETALIRIWDKICGGSKKILGFLSVVLFTTLRRQITSYSDLRVFFESVKNLKDDPETADLIVNKAIDLWQQDKGHSEFVIHRKDN